MNSHGITSARYATTDTAQNAQVIAIRNGREEHRRANDDIEGGGMLAYLAGGGRIDPYIAPSPTTNDVRAEAQRRIIALVGATDLNGCLIKQLNANMMANELSDIRFTRALTPAEEATAAYLRNLAAAIKSIRAKSNILEPNPPADYTDNSYWT